MMMMSNSVHREHLTRRQQREQNTDTGTAWEGQRAPGALAQKAPTVAPLSSASGIS